MKFWIRNIEFTAGDKLFKNEDGDGGFRIEFDVPFSNSEEPDVSEIKIYNLTNSSIEAIESKAYGILNVGYGDDIGNILSGKIEEIETDWSGVDKITEIKVSDGGIEWRNTRVQKTYAPQSTARYIMTDLASMLGLEVVEITPKEDIIYQLGRTISGDVEKALKGLVEDTDSKMYIDKGKLYIRPEDKGTSTGFLLSADTGLLGSPQKTEEQTDNKEEKTIKYNVSCLLNHRLSTDSIIQIDSKTLKGNYRIESGTHKCNDNTFTTDLVVVPV